MGGGGGFHFAMTLNDMNEIVERYPGCKLFHSCEHPPFSILRCITTLRLLAGVRDGEHIDLSGREGVSQWR